MNTTTMHKPTEADRVSRYKNSRQPAQESIHCIPKRVICLKNFLKATAIQGKPLYTMGSHTFKGIAM